MERRQFINNALLSIASPLIQPLSELNVHSVNVLQEVAREIPIVGEYDVIICGAGPAGVSAAIEAGRNGAKTLLLEVHGCLGGVWTSGNLTWIIDNQNKPGIMREIMQDLTQRGGSATISGGDSFGFDVEEMKVLLEEYCLKANVTVRLFTRVVATAQKDNRLTHIVTESKSGREAWAGKIFIDCSGDGDLAAQAGCKFKYGGSDGVGQPMSLLCLVSGIHYDKIKPFVRDAEDSKIGTPSKKRLESEIIRGGINPSYTRPGLYPIREDLYMLMANHEYGFNGTDANQLSLATLRARAELHKIVNGLRNLGGVWKNLRIVATGEQIGVREGRRINGLYTVTRKDLIEGVRHQDAVCRVNMGVDVHSVKKDDEAKGNYSRGVKLLPYDIPMRAMIAADIQGLMMAGRCISGDFIAHSSYRVTGNAVPMGQAAGRVGAIAAISNRLPQEVKWEEVKWQVE
jgi:hypothetical protein